MTPKVSIITPAYNAGNTLFKTINSVTGQSYENWEHLIVDDGSTDNTSALIQEYANKDPRIKPIFFKNNKGIVKARNAAINEASGRYIAFIDADDIWLKFKLEKQLHFLFEHNLPLTFSSYYVIDEKDRIKAEYNAPKRLTYRKLLKSNFIGNLTGIYDVKYFGKRFMPDFHIHQDYAHWLKLMKDIPYVLGIQEKLAKYRKDGSGITTNKLRSATWQWSIYRESENISIPKSLYLMFWYTYFGITKYKSV